MKTWICGFAVASAIGALIVAGCDAGVEPDGQGGGQSSGTANGGDTGFTTGTGTIDCSTELECSADGGSIVCDGEVVAACAPGEACAAGECKPACEAALINKSSVGCEYYTANPDVTFSQGACFAAFVANTGSTPATITVERDGTALDTATFARIPAGSGQAITYTPLTGNQIPPGEIAVLFLAQHNPGALYTPPCPPGITAAVESEDAALHATGIARSFRIATDVPVVAYDIFPYGGGTSAITSATLLLPTSAWDTNYIAVAPYKTFQSDTPDLYSWIQIIAAEDGTDVTISPTVAIVGGAGVAPTAQGVPATYSINRGEVLQFTQWQALDGSPIQTTKPVGVIGGNRCMNVPAISGGACDAGHQMIPPVRALGSEYVAVRYRNRNGVEESPPWRLVGAVDGTSLTWEPAPPPGAPTTIGVGQVVEFAAAGPFVVRSQDADHPFYMSAHMTGCADAGGDPFLDCKGDPESVNVIPPAQYLNTYVFFTDPTYPETNLVFVRKKGDDGFKDVDLDCAGALTGWQPIGTSGNYEYTRFDLITGNFVPNGQCDNGRHEVKSDAPFGVTVWGWGSGATGGVIEGGGAGFYSQYVSYAYPAGASVEPITNVIVPPVPE